MNIASSADCTLKSLAAKHGVVEKTIQRDLAALESAGFTI